MCTSYTWTQHKEKCVCAVTIETLLKNNLQRRTHSYRLLTNSFKLIAMPRIHKSRRTCQRSHCSRSIWTKRSPGARRARRLVSCVSEKKNAWILESVINPRRKREKNHFLAKTTCEKTDVASLQETRDTYECVQHPSCDTTWLELDRCFACRQRSYRTFCP